MEKSNKHSASTPLTNSSPTAHQQNQSAFHCKPLGGICLYNEQYQRYIQTKQNNSQLKSTLNFPHHISNPANHQKQLEQPYFQELGQKEAMKSEMFDLMPKTHNISAQIERIISDLKHSQLSTANLLEEIKKNTKTQEYDKISSFQEIFQLYTQKNIHKFSTIMQKIEQELRRKFSQLLKRVKKEEEDKLRSHYLKIHVNQSTQTHLDHHTQDLEEIQKELEKELDLKKIEYDTLFNHKTQTLVEFNDPSVVLEDKLKKQQAFIKNLEFKIKEKNMEMKRLQNQLKSVQENLFSKLMQRKSSLKSELESIEEDYPKENFEEKKRLSVALKKKFRNKLQKRRAESVMIPQNYQHNKLKDILSSITSLQNYESNSMRQIKNMNNSQREKEKSLGNRFSIFDGKEKKRKPSNLRRNQLKVPERYKNKDFIKPHTNNQPWKPKKMENFQKRFLRKSQSMLYTQLQKLNQSKMSSQKSYNHKFTAPRLSVQNHIFQLRNHKARDSRPRLRYSVQTKDEFRRTLELKYSKLLQKEPKKTHVSIFENKQPQKNGRTLKQVSFHLKNDTVPNYKLHSHQIDILIVNSSTANAFVPNQPLSTSSEINRPLIVAKLRNEKIKLTKSKLTKKTHFRTTSQLNSLNKQLIMMPQKSCEEIQEEASFSMDSKENHLDQPSQRDYGYLGSKMQKKEDTQQLNEPSNSQESKLFESRVKSLIHKCRSLEQFRREFHKIHKGCGQNCQHLKKYLQIFEKLKHLPMRATIKMKVQNLNSHIKSSLSKSKSKHD